jgi:hypothetical protein
MLKNESIRLYNIILWAIRVSLLFAIFGAVLSQQWAVLFASLFTFILAFSPKWFERKYHILLPIEFELIIVFFFYATLFLGEVHGYYTRFWWWDIVLHTGSAIAFGFIGFMIMYLLYRSNRIKANPAVIAIFSFCFALAVGTVWEIFEFFMDQFFGLNMQKSGLVDTMWDLIVDSLGALFASIGGYFYLKKMEFFLFGRSVRKFESENPGFFK